MERVAENEVVGGRNGSGGRAERSVIEGRISELRSRHGEIEQRLLELDRHLSLTSDEQVERARLKKEKLWSKDRIVALTHLLAIA
jgi:hypothetical protein